MPDWTTYPGLVAPDCVVCCTPAGPGTCFCEIQFPGPLTGPPIFASLADAQTAIAAGQVGNCIAYIRPSQGGGSLPSFTFSAVFPGPNDLLLSLAGSSISFSNGVASLNLKAGSQLQLIWSINHEGGSIGAAIIDCNYFGYFGEGGTPAFLTFVNNDAVGTSGTFTFPDLIPYDGEFVLYFFSSDAESSSTWEVIADNTMTVNPPVALYDDSGTTRRLEACPRLLLPQPGEDGPVYYADQAAAQAAMDALAVDCLGFWLSEESTVDSASVTFSSDTLTADFSLSNTDAPAIRPLAVSLNLMGSSTLTCAYDVSTNGLVGGGGAVGMRVFDDGWNTINIQTALWPNPITGHLISTFTFAVPYTGKFYIQLLTLSGNAPPSNPRTVTGSFVLTSNDTISANPPQLLYSNGMACPGRLDCPGP
jgi:hypothetical protein